MSVLKRCPSYLESNKGSKERQGPFYRGVRLLEVSVKRESTVLHFIKFGSSNSQLKRHEGVSYIILALQEQSLQHCVARAIR